MPVKPSAFGPRALAAALRRWLRDLAALRRPTVPAAVDCALQAGLRVTISLAAETSADLGEAAPLDSGGLLVEVAGLRCSTPVLSRLTEDNGRLLGEAVRDALKSKSTDAKELGYLSILGSAFKRLADVESRAVALRHYLHFRELQTANLALEDVMKIRAIGADAKLELDEKIERVRRLLFGARPPAER